MSLDELVASDRKFVMTKLCFKLKEHSKVKIFHFCEFRC